MRPGYLFCKYTLDFILALLGMLALWPVFLAIAVLIKVQSPGPVFFRQRRIGKDKSEFLIFKFRTMRMDTPKDVPTHQLDNPEQYITPIGRFLRKSSLDELPQILNILKGEMSIIGPRPALWNQFDLIAERDKYGANHLRPGLTGWAQINGRDELPIPVKARLDGDYVQNLGPVIDIKTFFLTFYIVVAAKGVVEGRKED